MTALKDREASKHRVKLTPPSYALKSRAPATKRDLSDALNAADQAVVALASEYEEWVREDLATLEAAFDALRASGGAHDAIAAVHDIAHDMSGQGGSFGYPLISTVGASLCKMLRDRETLDGRYLDATAVHIDAMRLIIVRPLKEDGGSEGAQLIAELEKVCLTIES